jgi:hypothetical protein
MKRIHLGQALVLLALPVLAAEAPAPVLKVSGIYSDLAYNVEGGDLLGMELLIVPAGSEAKDHWNVFVQIAEGGAPYCVVVPLTINGAKIEFTIPPGGSYGGTRFAGTISATEIRLSIPQGPEERLRRGKSYWQ